MRIATFEQLSYRQDFLSLVRLLVHTNVSQRTFSYGMGLQGILAPEYVEVSSHCPLFSLPFAILGHLSSLIFFVIIFSLQLCFRCARIVVLSSLTMQQMPTRLLSSTSIDLEDLWWLLVQICDGGWIFFISAIEQIQHTLHFCQKPMIFLVLTPIITPCPLAES